MTILGSQVRSVGDEPRAVASETFHQFYLLMRSSSPDKDVQRCCLTSTAQSAHE